MRVAEEEERRLLMPASGGSFRFVVDVERLSTRREGVQMDRQTDRQGRRDLHRRLAKGSKRRRRRQRRRRRRRVRLGCSVGNMWPDKAVNISTHTQDKVRGASQHGANSLVASLVGFSARVRKQLML